MFVENKQLKTHYVRHIFIGPRKTLKTTLYFNYLPGFRLLYLMKNRISSIFEYEVY